MKFSVHKVLLEHSHVHLFMYFLWLLSPYNDGLAQLQRKPYDLRCKAYNIYYVSLYRKCLLIQDLLNYETKAMLIFNCHF